MSRELINRISVKKDGIYLSIHSSNDNAPYHSVKIKSLSDIYDLEGQKGLDREIIKIICEYGELRGNHNSLKKYYYALNSAETNNIRKKYLDLNNYYYNLLSEDDKNSLYTTNMSEKAKQYRNHSKDLYNEMYSKIANKCFEYDLINKKTKESNKSFDYCHKIISTILDVSDDYKINFDSKTPFQDFGNDDDSEFGNMYSFSKYYKEILEKLSIKIDNISTRNWSDGKYIIDFGENNELELSVYENVDNVIDNIETIIAMQKQKENGIFYE